MSEEVENVEQEEEAVEMVFEGAAPSEGLDSYLEVSAKATIGAGDEATYKGAKGFYKFGKDLAEAVEMFTEDVVFSNFRAQAKIKLQALMRSRVAKGQDVSNLLATWKPGVQLERTPVDPIVAAENKFDQLDKDAQDAFIEKLLARQKG